MQIGPDGEPPALEIGSVVAKLSWQGLTPFATRVAINEPVLEIGYDGTAIDLKGLGRLRGDGGASPAPELDITDGALRINTPAGELTGLFKAQGIWPQNLAAEIHVAPTELETRQGRLSLEAGRLELQSKDDVVFGEAELQIATLAFGATRLENLLFSASRADSSIENVRWSIIADQLERRDQSVSMFNASGIIAPNMDATSDSPIWQLLQNIQGAGDTAKLNVGNASAEATAFIFDLSRKTDSEVQISAELGLLEVSGSLGGASDLVFIYEGELDPSRGQIEGDGELILNDAKLSAEILDPLSHSPAGIGPLAKHGERLSQTLREATSAFSSRVKYRLDADWSGDWQVLVTSTADLFGDNGTNLTLSPGLSGAVLSATPNDLRLSGIASLRGGDGPELTADLKSLSFDGENFQLSAGGIELNPWTVDGTTISAKLNRGSLLRLDGTVSTELLGEVTFDGDAFGWRLNDARIFGGVDARTNEAGLRVQMLESDCLGLALSSADRSDTLSIGSVSTALCPLEGRLLDRTGATGRGELRLGDIEIPFSGLNLAGTASLPDVKIDWQSGRELGLSLVAPTAELDMRIAGRSLLINAQEPSLGIQLGEQTRFNATLENTHLSGALIPADVVVPSLSFNGTLRDGKFDGTAIADEAVVKDARPDPLFEPVRANVRANFQNSDLTGEADLALDGDGYRVGEAGLELNLVTLTGDANIRSDRLEFVPGGFQPTRLSERVRGLLTNASGALTAKANLNLDGGALSGSGTVEILDLGFDTLRVGRVTGVEGALVFDDLLKLTTPPGQTVTIESIEPGLLLKKGDIRFQLKENGEARLEQARWPFAGGNLVVQPVSWTIAGQRDAVIVSAEAIELSGLIEELALPDLDADGTVSGLVPITFEGGNVLVQNALLTADERGGFIRYIGQSVSEVQTQDVRVDSAFQALRDFRFSVLELGIDGNLIGDLLLRVKLLGFNPDVLGGAEFSFNITIDSRFVDLIQSGRRALGTEWLARATLANPSTDESDEAE
ncbi:MAG: YdbH domain-containing protein [Pseudomonadota bacterium]